MQKLSKRPIMGVAFIVLSFLLWGGALLCPFVEAPLSTRAGMGVSFYGLSYLTFGIGCKLCGQAMWPAVKAWVSRGLHRGGPLTKGDQDVLLGEDCDSRGR